MESQMLEFHYATKQRSEVQGAAGAEPDHGGGEARDGQEPADGIEDRSGLLGRG